MRKINIQYKLFVVSTSTLSLVLLAVSEFVKNLDAEIVELIHYFDHFMCLIFFADFLYTFKKAKNKFQFLKFGWIDLLASVPNIELLRYFRIARIFKIIRAIKSSKYLLISINKNKRANVFLMTSLTAILLVFIGAVSILQFENIPDSNINTPEIAIWWSLVTITTVGYGDYYPVTTGGRVLATILMIYGIGLFGTLSGVYASYFLRATNEREISEIEELRNEIKELKEILSDKRDAA